MQLFKILWMNWIYLVLSLMGAVSIVRSFIYYLYAITSQMNKSLDLDRSQPPLFIQVRRQLQAVSTSTKYMLPDVITLRSSKRRPEHPYTRIAPRRGQTHTT